MIENECMNEFILFFNVIIWQRFSQITGYWERMNYDVEKLRCIRFKQNFTSNYSYKQTASETLIQIHTNTLKKIKSKSV